MIMHDHPLFIVYLGMKTVYKNSQKSREAKKQKSKRAGKSRKQRGKEAKKRKKQRSKGAEKQKQRSKGAEQSKETGIQLKSQNGKKRNPKINAVTLLVKSRHKNKLSIEVRAVR